MRRQTGFSRCLALVVGVAIMCVAPGLSVAQVKPEVESGLKPYTSQAGQVSGTLKVGSSETIKQLVDLWAADFQKRHTKAKVENETIHFTEAARVAQVNVYPMPEGADLVAVSHPLSEQDLKAVAKNRGAEAIRVTGALDAIVLVVNHRNPLPGLTLDQVAGVFGQSSKGQTGTGIWAELGLNGKLGGVAINRYGRDAESGTFAAFREMALGGNVQQTDVRSEPGSMSVVLEVGTDEAGIGYAATGFAARSKKVRVVPLARQTGEPFIGPTNESVLSGAYPLRRELYLYAIPGDNGTLSPLVKEFLTFILSRQGQEIVKQDGFFPLPAHVAEASLQKLTVEPRVAAAEQKATR